MRPAKPCFCTSGHPPAPPCAEERARAARSGCPSGRSARSRGRPAPGRRPYLRASRCSRTSAVTSTSSISSARSSTRVGHGLAHRDAGDLGDDVVQALDVLDVERGVDVDAGVEQLVHVLPALVVPRAGGVGVGQLVQQEQRGCRARAASRSNSSSRVPRYSMTRRGMTSRPSSSRAVSARPWVSTIPTTTSTPSARLARAASSMVKVFPTPGEAPRNTLSCPRCCRASSSRRRRSRASGSGRVCVTCGPVGSALRYASPAGHAVRAGHRAAGHTRCRVVRITSISLMPAKGTSKPPRP